jgi:hypothetical protein
VQGGILNLNGQVTMTGALSLNSLSVASAQPFNETGTRRSSGTTTNIYGVRDTFNGGITIQNLGINGAFGSTVTPTFQGADLFSSSQNINVMGTAAGFTYPGVTTANANFVDSAFSNIDDFGGGSGHVNLLGGRVQLNSGDAFGTASVFEGQTSPTVAFAEKAVLQLQRGVSTNPNSNLTIGPLTGYVTAVVISNRGLGYGTAAITASLTGGGGGTGAILNTIVPSSGTITGITVNTVGTGYTLLPTLSLNVTGTTVAVGTPVLSSVIALRGNDQ